MVQRAPKLNRRQFNIAVASSLAGATWSPALRAAERADVIVIGAGLAGLNAALLLESQGLSVVVLEAADHVGGRTRTLQLPIGYTNAGGQTIGPFYARMRDLIRQLEVPLVPVPARVAIGNYINGSLVASSDWASSRANRTVGVEREVQPSALEFFHLSTENPLPSPDNWTDPEFARYDIPMGAYLRSRGASEEALRLIDVTLNAFDLASASALAYLRDIRRFQWDIVAGDARTRSTYGASDDDGLEFNEVAGGTQRFPEAIANALRQEVRLRHFVKSIDMTADGVEVRTLDRQRYSARYVVSAVPFSALRNIHVTPGFPALQREAISQSAHGNAVRVFMEFSTPFWEQDIGEPGLFSDTAIERVFARRNEDGEIYLLDCWVNGRGAERLDQMAAADVGEFVVAELGRIRPSTRGRVRVLQVHSWANHSMSGCCRHVFHAGEVTRWATTMSQPHGRLHLAGEQTRTLENGMEAAVESGERAALEILEREG